MIVCGISQIPSSLKPQYFRNLMFSQGDTFVIVYSWSNIQLKSTVALLFSKELEEQKVVFYSLLPFAALLKGSLAVSHIQKHTMSLFIILPIMSFFSSLIYRIFCFFISPYLSLYFPASTVSLSFSLYLSPPSLSLFPSPLPVSFLFCLPLSVSVFVPDSSSRGSVCGKGKLIV